MQYRKIFICTVTLLSFLPLGWGCLAQNTQVIQNDINNLIQKLDDKQQNEQKQAAIELLHYGQVAVKPLIKALKSANPKVRFYAVQLLGRIGDTKATEAMMRVFNDNQEYVASQAAEALAYNKNIEKQALPQLLKLLQNESTKLRFLTSITLSGTSSSEIYNIILADKSAFETIMKISRKEEDEKTRDLLLTFLANISANIDTNSATYSKEKELIKKRLVEGLSDKSPVVRSSAILNLVIVYPRGSETTKYLFEMANDKDNLVRSTVAFSLSGKIIDFSRKNELLLKLFNDNDAQVKINAAFAFAAAGDYRGYDFALKSLDNDDLSVQSSAAQVLGEIGNTDSLPLLEKKLKETRNPFLQRNLSIAINKIKGK